MIRAVEMAESTRLTRMGLAHVTSLTRLMTHASLERLAAGTWIQSCLYEDQRRGSCPCIRFFAQFTIIPLVNSSSLPSDQSLTPVPDKSG